MASTPAAARNAASRLNWTALLSTSLKPTTTQSLVSFRKRYDDVKRNLAVLQDAHKEIDFTAYRAVLSNKKVVDEAEKMWKTFKPSKVDLAGQMRVIGELETKAVAKAHEAGERINAELKDLSDTLKNIETARSVDQLTVDDVVQARPELIEVVENRLKDGKWSVPGYYEKFGAKSAF